MIKNQEVRILWLTDIHYAEVYANLVDSPQFIEFRDQFNAKVVKEHKVCAFNYIFITGDLAQAGSSEDYKHLKATLLDPLLNDIKNVRKPVPKVITIPGNHDIMWTETDFLKEYIDYIQPDEAAEPKRSEFMVGKDKEFRELFNDYQGFIKGELKGEYKDFYELPVKNKSLITHKNYLEHRLFGYIVDVKHKTIIVLLNTAWFSLGGKFNDLYIGTIKEFDSNDNGEIEPTDANFKRWFKTKDVLTEYGKQVSGVQWFPYDDLAKVLKNYPDYFVITCMHHPRNWLEWSESYSFAESNAEDMIAARLKALTMSSDMVLTGHEHVPVDFGSERILNGVLHLKGGCFLEDNQHKETQFQKSWYSILDINIDNKKVIQKKNWFNTKTDSWEPADDGVYFGKKSGIYQLTGFRKKKTLTDFRRKPDAGLRSYLEEAFDTTFKDGEFVFLEDFVDDHFRVYLIRLEEKFSLCFLAQETGGYDHMADDAFYNKLKDLLCAHSDVKYVRFVFLDLLVDGELKTQYEEKDCNRGKAYNAVLKAADNLHDVFRHGFFAHWEPKQLNERQAEMKGFKPYADLRLINRVIPYWIAERFWI